MKRRLQIGMKGKLLMTFLAASIFSFGLAGWWGNRLAESVLVDETFNQLESVRQGKKNALETLFRTMGNQLHTLAEDRMTIAALSEFSAQYQTLLAQSGVSDARLVRMRQALRSFYAVDFANEYRRRNDNRAPDVLPYFTSLSPGAIALQYLYIADNPNPPGDKALQDRAADTAGYHDVHARYHPLFHDYLTRFGYEDILLVDGNTDAVVYSVAKHIDFAASLADGLLATSGLGAACRQAKQSGGPVVSFVDFGLYEPDFGAPICFLAIPVDAGDRKAGVLVFAVSGASINTLLQENSGLGQSGETYLVNPDRLLRSDTRLDPRTYGLVESLRNPGKALISSETAALALQGKSGQKTVVNYRGATVLSSYAPVQVFDRVWALLVETDLSEALQPVQRMNTSMYMVGVIILAVMTLLALFAARRFSAPLVKGCAFAEAITGGNYNATLRLPGRDEAGALARALNQMARSLSEQDWLKTGKSELNDQLRGELGIEELGRRCISYLVQHLDAQLGAFYLLQGKYLVLTASYAFCDRRGNLSRIAIGEGLVGQAALEQELIVFHRPAHSTPALHYGIDQTVPDYFLCAPIVFERSLLGILQIGSSREFTPLMRQLITENIENIAISLHSAQTRSEVQELLRFSQEQADVLEAQHAQLKSANSELQAQTEALRASEESLQTQQEELRVTNEELAERSHALEEQRNAIRNKNVQLKKAHNEIRRKAQELELASKYKSEFLANMSHELRTPLNSILILAQLLKENRENNLTDKQLEFANTIYTSGAGLLALINEVLDLSKVEAGKMELEIRDLELSDLAEGLIRTFAPIAASKGLQLDVEVDPTLPPSIHTDSRRVLQIIHNLLTNAFKFTERGGVLVSIQSPAEDMDLPRCGLTPAQAVAIAVTDTGIGVAEDKQALIFEAFQQADGTTNRKYGGTGLGLAISREFAILLGGEIQLISAPDEGSTFTLVLPLVFTPQADSDTSRTTYREVETFDDPATACQPRPDYPTDDRDHLKTGDKTLLIIEDDPNFSRILCNIGQEKGFKCIISPDGEKGLDLAGNLTPSAIVLDIGLPGMDGMKVMDQLKNSPKTRHIPVHVISAFDESLDAMRMGAIGYLTKPVSMEQLDQVFDRIDDLISRPVKKLLVVEDNPSQRQAIIELIGNNDVQSRAVGRGDEAWALLQHEQFDCIILDLGLADMPGIELLERIDANPKLARIPIIIYTGRDITPKEEARLARLSDSIIIKGVRSPERLLDETALFLHRVQANLPQEKQRMLKKVHDRQSILEDKKILVIDDDRRNIYAISAVLESHGMKVFSGDTGRECLAMLEKHGDVDLVLMDIMMPEMDGYEAIRTIRQDPRFKALPIIALTAKAMLGDRGKCIEAGANDYLAKPVDTDKLLSLLRVWLYT